MNDDRDRADDQHELINAISYKMALPIIVVCSFVLVVCFAICCYFAKRKASRPTKVGGYKKVTLNVDKGDPLRETKNDMCPVCIDDFKNKEVLAICPCNHVFHKKCLRAWLAQRAICPMCMAAVPSNHHHHHHKFFGSAGHPFALPPTVGTAAGMFPSQV